MSTTAAPFSPSWDRAVVYGDGVFETLLICDGDIPLWRWHRQRLLDSLRRLDIASDFSSLEEQLFQQAHRQQDGVARLVVARSGGQRGYDGRTATSTVSDLRCFPLPCYPQEWLHAGVRLHLCQQRLARNPALAGIKHLNRLEQVMAAGEFSRQWADEGLMLDDAGSVIECSSSNIFLLRDNVLHTPSLAQCGVAGVMRRYLLEVMAPALAVPTVVSRITLDQLLVADGVFICNGVFGIRPVRSIGVVQLPAATGTVRQMQAELARMGYARLYG